MEPIQPLFAGALATLVRPAPLTMAKIAFAWRVAVGAAVARVTRVALGPTHVLDVVLDDDRFGDELERSLPDVLGRLQTMLGAEEVRWLRLQRPARRRKPGRRGRPTGTSPSRSHEGDAS